MPNVVMRAKPGEARREELDPTHIVDVFPYLRDMYEAAWEMKKFYDESGVLRKDIKAGKRIRTGWAPMHALVHGEQIFGECFWVDKQKLHAFYEMYPHYCYVRRF